MYSASHPVLLTIPQNGIQTKKERISKLFPRNTVLILSVVQFVFAILTVILQLIIIAKKRCYRYGAYWQCYNPIGEIGSGFWTGIFFGISGGMGFLVSQRPSHCSIIAFMVMNIVSSLFCLPLIVLAGIGFSYRESTVHIICFGIQMLIALGQAATAIVASGFSCRVVCCGKMQNPGTVIYHPQNIQPQTLYNTQTIPNTNLVSTNYPPLNETSNPEAATDTSASGFSEKPPKYSAAVNDPQEWENFENIQI